MKLMFCILVFLLSLGEGVLHATETASSGAGKGVQKKPQDQKVTLKLLEPISPQRHTDEGETITSNLGEILDDPKNEALKSIKVLGKKKRLEGPTRAIKIIWEEVSLDVQPTAEQAARGVQVPAANSLKEPVKRPLQSAFVQKTPETVQSGTPIEAKGDVDGLLAAARSLLIRVQRQGLQISPSSISSGLDVNTSSGRGPSAERVPEKGASSETRRLRTDATQGSSVAGDQGARRTERGDSAHSVDGVSSPFRSRSPVSPGSTSPFSNPSSSSPYTFTSSRGSGFGNPYQGGSPWPARDQKKKEKSSREEAGSGTVFASPSSARPTFPSREGEGLSSHGPSAHGLSSRGTYGPVSSEEGDGGVEEERRPEEGRDAPSGEEGSISGEGSESEAAFRQASKPKKPGKMGHRKKGKRKEGPLGTDFEGTDAEFAYPLGESSDGSGDRNLHIPVIRVEYDYESCSPRIDFAFKASDSSG